MPDGPAAPRVAVIVNMITPYTNNLFNQLQEDGLQLSILTCTEREPNRLWETPARRYPKTALPGFALRLGEGRFAHVNAGVWRALGKLKPDVVVINGFYPTMVAAALWARFNGSRLALTTDGWAETMPGTLYHRIVRPLVLGWCQAVITPGDKGRAFFLSQGFAPERIFRAPLIPAWPPPADIPGYDERPFHLLWCARLDWKTKNVEFFMRLVEALKKRRPELRVRIVGAGEAESELIARLDRAQADYRHDRYVPWRDMASVYATARVLALPSLWEPWGLVCDEALMCGVPCVVSPHVGAGDDAVLTGVNGHVLRLEVEAWAEAVLDIAFDESNWRTLSAGARRITNHRSLARSARSFADAVRAAVAAPWRGLSHPT